MPKAVEQHSTCTPRRPLPTVGNLSRLALREAILDRVERLLDLADALDGDPDLEPDHDGEVEPDEASLHPATLAADRVPAVVIRSPARTFREPGTPPPTKPPHFPARPTPNRPPRGSGTMQGVR